MKTTVDIDAIHRVLKREYSRHRMPVVELIQTATNDPYRVLTATILSARTKDQVTAAASNRLFSRAPRIDDLRRLSVSEIETCIYPVGFWKQKARYLHTLPDCLDELYCGTIPDTVDELIRLPGVGRKTANLVVAVAFGKPAICVDVHVHRICNRLGYVQTATPLHTEMKLRSILPARYWISINSYLVSFGQHTCTPVSPRCAGCPIARWCNRVGVTSRNEGSRLRA